jgi:hypothetical protein
MKKFITINQTNFIEIGKREGIKVDAIDGILFDWIKTFMISDKALKKLIDKELYIWVSYKKIREDNPLCNINSNDVVGRRLNKLEKLGLIKKFLSKEDGNKTFIALTKFAYDYLLEDRELPTQESGDYLPTSRELPTQESDNSKLKESYNSKLIDTTKTTDKPDKVSVTMQSGYKVANYLLDKILLWKPNFKKPNIDDWAKDIDRAIRLDHRTEQELIDCIDWIYSPKGDWWRPNILSCKKLREKFDIMDAKKITTNSNQNEVSGEDATITKRGWVV